MAKQPDRPLFVLDQNFPQPILDQALSTYVLGLEIKPLRLVDPQLTAGVEDWQVILGLHQLGAEGFITNDEAMLGNPRVAAVIGQTGLSVVICSGTGHDPIVASGLLLAHLPAVAKRHRARAAQVWVIKTREQRPMTLGDLRTQLGSKGHRLDDYLLTKAELDEPVVAR